MTHLLVQPEGRKTAGAVGWSEGAGGKKRRWRGESEKREERARDDHLRLSSISDKNKVNGEWGCQRGGCCSARAWRGELLRTGGHGGVDASQTGPYQSERGKGKKYDDRCYRPRGIQ